MSLIKNKSLIKYLLPPLLISLYPVIFLYAVNIEMLNIRQTVIPLVIATSIALLSFILFSLFTRSPLKGSLVAVVFLILFWNYDLFYQGLFFLFNLRKSITLVIMLCFFGLIFYLIQRTNKDKLEIINTAFLVIASFLIVINLFTIIPGEINKQAAASESTEYQSGREELSALTGKPDLYLIIFDEYTRIDTMADVWGYDNSDLADHFNQVGFFLAEESTVKHGGTLHSLAELLNLEHLSEGKSDAQLVALYNNNLLFSYFNDRGYEIYFLDGLDHPLRGNLPDYINLITYEDIRETRYTILTDSFFSLLLSRSILGPFEHTFGFNQPGLFYYQGNLGFFDYLRHELPVRETPKFVFAHINSPHLPYVFDREGNLTNNQVHFFQYQELKPEQLKEMYLEQYIFITEVIKDLSVSIRENSMNDVIIIFQSDHGPRPTSSGNESWDDAYKVLNAIYFPDRDYSKLNEQITPVNTMRVVLNRYFDEEYEMLE